MCVCVSSWRTHRVKDRKGYWRSTRTSASKSWMRGRRYYIYQNVKFTFKMNENLLLGQILYCNESHSQHSSFWDSIRCLTWLIITVHRLGDQIYSIFILCSPVLLETLSPISAGPTGHVSKVWFLHMKGRLFFLPQRKWSSCIFWDIVFLSFFASCMAQKNVCQSMNTSKLKPQNYNQSSRATTSQHCWRVPLCPAQAQCLPHI